jgi:hypothetical protein
MTTGHSRKRLFGEAAAKLGLGLGMVGVLLAGSEGILRLVGFQYHAPSPITIWNSARDQEMVTSDGRFRFHPYWFWEVRPGTPIPNCGSERINPAGYRGPARPPAPAPGKRRIVVLGDSSTFGYGVCQPDTYAALLERELPDAEVLNFGMIGYSAFQGEQLLEGRVLAYRPRVVLAAFGTVNELLPALGYDVDEKFRITSRVGPWAALWRDRLREVRLFQLADRLAAGGGHRTARGRPLLGKAEPRLARLQAEPERRQFRTVAGTDRHLGEGPRGSAGLDWTTTASGGGKPLALDRGV